MNNNKCVCVYVCVCGCVSVCMRAKWNKMGVNDHTIERVRGRWNVSLNILLFVVINF